MKLRFIYGKASSGKSTFCLEDIKREMKRNLGRKHILLVPEQLSFESERKVIDYIGGVGLNDVYVLTFKRMAYWTFKECGGMAQKHIDKCGKSMMLYSVLEEIEEELMVFSKSAAYGGFIEKILSIISEFKRYNITSDQLVQLKEKAIGNGLLYNKICDLQKIFESFNDKLHESYIDGDDDLLLMKEKLPSCDIFDKSIIWIDEFSGFTPQQYTILEELIKRSDKVNITLNMELDVESRERGEMLAPIFETEKRVLDICERLGVSIEEPVRVGGEVENKSKELGFLQDNYFKYPFKPYKESVKDISIFKALNPYSEVENLAGEIQRIIREEKANYSSIAVVSRDMERYENIIESVFTENKIPFFMDKKKEASRNPIVISMIAAMEIYNRNWNYESVFSFLKSGMIPWKDEDVDLLENYILRTGLKGKKAWNDDESWYTRLFETFNITEEYKKYFNIEDPGVELNKEILTSILEGKLSQREKSILELSDEDMEVLGDLNCSRAIFDSYFEEKIEKIFRINNLRNELIGKILPFHDGMKGNKKCIVMAETLFDFLEKIEMYELINQRIEMFLDEGKSELAEEYGHIWNVIIEVLEQMVECFGEEKMKVQKFTDILRMGLQHHKMGFIPNTLDQVLVSSVERVKSHETQYLFILGINDGVFPSSDFNEGILSDLDRGYLREEGVELAKDTKEKTLDEQYMIYTTLAIPSKKLRMSYPVGDSEGKTLRASIIISRMKSLFPGIKEESNISKKKLDELLSGKTTAFNNLILSLRKEEGYGDIHPLWNEVYRWFKEDDNLGEKIDTLISFFEYENKVQNLTPESVKNLYTRDNLFSVSKLERYNECPFSYFIRYGLKAKERKTFELSAPDLGTFMHHIIDGFSKEVKREKRVWGELEEKWCREKIDELVERGMEEPVGRIFKTIPKYRYFGKRIKKVINKSMWVVVEHMRRSEFSPYGYEMEFGGKEYSPIEIELDDGTVVKLIGKIDRVDKLIMNSEEYFRIIDYKSGNKSLKLAQIYYGLQLQLVTYLDAILESERNKNALPSAPAGIFYLKIDDPIIKSGGRISEEKLQQEILKKLKMKGLVLKDSEIITKMDSAIEGLSLIIPAGVKKDGSLREGSGTNMATLEQFQTLREHVRYKLKETCDKILGGEIDIYPYKAVTGESACAFCDFSHVCAFDPLLKENNYRIVSDIKDNLIWDMMNRNEDENTNKEEISCQE